MGYDQPTYKNLSVLLIFIGGMGLTIETGGVRDVDGDI